MSPATKVDFMFEGNIPDTFSLYNVIVSSFTWDLRHHTAIKFFATI
jgi:hypothetical protein